jgi:hypothetical protein
MISKSINFCGQRVTLACDGNCSKAWGIQARPRHHFQPEDEEPDDYVYLPDSALGTAPGPGETVILAEGNDTKPHAVRMTDGAGTNRWCARQCERKVMVEDGEEIRVRDMEHPRPNMPGLHPGWADAVHRVSS